MTSPFLITTTSDSADGVILQVGINPTWCEGFRAGIEAALAMLEAHSPGADTDDTTDS